MRTIRMTSDTAFGAPPRVLAAQRKHITTMTAPIRTDIRECLKPVRNAMVNLVLIINLHEIILGQSTMKNYHRCTYSSRLRYTLRYHFLVALFVACISTIFALVTRCVQ